VELIHLDFFNGKNVRTDSITMILFSRDVGVLFMISLDSYGVRTTTREGLFFSIMLFSY
jgi:hypothetical protein